MHRMDKPDTQLPSEIQGKTSVTDMKKCWCFPLASAGAESDAATGCSLKWSSCFYCSCQSETGWVFGRAWTGAGHLLFNWVNCACGLLGHKGKCVGGEQGSAVCGQLWESEPQWKAASAASQSQRVQHLWYRSREDSCICHPRDALSLVQTGTELLQMLLVQYFSLLLVIMWFTEDF